MNNILLQFLCMVAIAFREIPLAESNCRQLCDNRKNPVCLKGATCAVTYNYVPFSKIGIPRPLPHSLSTKAKCHQRYIGNVTTHHVGIEMIWKIAGKNIGSQGVQEFHITIRDMSEMSPTTEAFLLINPNRTMTTNGDVTFIYYYAGNDEESGPEINPNGRYQITLESVPVFIRGEHTWPETLRERVMIPKFFKKEQCENDTTTPMPPTKSNDVHTWQVLTTVLGMICLIVGVIATAAFSWKRRKAAHNAYIASREHRILVLLNMDDKAEVARQTNWTATALSRVRKMGDVTVKYNRWETKEIMEKGIAKWLDERVSWANKIIISSTPDDLRNETTTYVFEQALENVMLQHISIDAEYKQVFIIHFDDKKNYNDCPFMKDDKYRKFHLDEEWAALCRSIHGCLNSEHEPLHLGNAV